MSNVYYVPSWAEHFESAKSKTYKHKSQTYMPNKHGLGYLRIMSHKDGPAMFGCWCAMIQVLSRYYPRQGYLTDTTMPDGVPWTPSDISLMTQMPEKLVESMLALCSSQAVGWLMVTEARIPQGYHEDTIVACQSPYPSPLHSHSPSPSPEIAQALPFGSSEFLEAWKSWTTHRREIKKRLTPTQTTAQLKSMAKMGEARAIAAIYHTIEKGWQGLREPEERTIGAKVGNRGDTGRRVTGFEDMEGDQ